MTKSIVLAMMAAVGIAYNKKLFWVLPIFIYTLGNSVGLPFAFYISDMLIPLEPINHLHMLGIDAPSWLQIIYPLLAIGIYFLQKRLKAEFEAEAKGPRL